MATWNLACYDYILFTQGIRSNPLILNVKQTINLASGFALKSPKLLTVQQSIQFNSQPAYHYGIANKIITQNIQLVQSTKPTKYASITHYINFNERFIIPKVRSISHQLTLVQQLSNPGRQITQSLILIDTINYNIVKQIIQTDQLNLVSKANLIKLNYNFNQQSTITLTHNAYVTFSYTNDSGITKSITIKAPDFEDTDEIHFNKVQHNTRNNDLIMYRDPIWPVYTVLNLHFSYLKQSDIYRLLDFLEFSLGQDITYIDFESRTWVGVITTPVGEIVQPGRFNLHAHLTLEVT